MQRRIQFVVVVATLAVSGLLGCTGEDGARTGVTNGISAAVSALIQAPVTAFIKDNFPAK